MALGVSSLLCSKNSTTYLIDMILSCILLLLGVNSFLLNTNTQHFAIDIIIAVSVGYLLSLHHSWPRLPCPLHHNKKTPQN